MTPANSPTYLSIQGIQVRWGCGRTFAYQAVLEMEQAGYLQRIWLGRCQRIAVESVLTWEAAHTRAKYDTTRTTVADLRAANDSPALPLDAPLSSDERRILYRKARLARTG